MDQVIRTAPRVGVINENPMTRDSRIEDNPSRNIRSRCHSYYLTHYIISENHNPTCLFTTSI